MNFIVIQFLGWYCFSIPVIRWRYSILIVLSNVFLLKIYTSLTVNLNFRSINMRLKYFYKGKNWKNRKIWLICIWGKHGSIKMLMKSSALMIYWGRFNCKMGILNLADIFIGGCVMLWESRNKYCRCLIKNCRKISKKRWNLVFLKISCNLCEASNKS